MLYWRFLEPDGAKLAGVSTLVGLYTKASNWVESMFKLIVCPIGSIDRITPTRPFAWNIPQVIGTVKRTACPGMYVSAAVIVGIANVTTIGDEFVMFVISNALGICITPGRYMLGMISYVTGCN